MIFERTDFVSVPVTDVEQPERFYGDTLGLPKISTRGFPEFQLGGKPAHAPQEVCTS